MGWAHAPIIETPSHRGNIITQCIVAAQPHPLPISRFACEARFHATRADGKKIPSSVKSLVLAPANKTS